MCHSRRQGSVIPFTPIQGPEAWLARDYRESERHIYRLTPEDISELDRAVSIATATGKAIQVHPSIRVALLNRVQKTYIDGATNAKESIYAEMSSLSVQDVTKDEFPLPKLGPKLKELLEEVRVGRGFQVIRQ